jgi:hypothetical protein
MWASCKNRSAVLVHVIKLFPQQHDRARCHNSQVRCRILGTKYYELVLVFSFYCISPECHAIFIREYHSNVTRIVFTVRLDRDILITVLHTLSLPLPVICSQDSLYGCSHNVNNRGVQLSKIICLHVTGSSLNNIQLVNKLLVVREPESSPLCPTTS